MANKKKRTLEEILDSLDEEQRQTTQKIRGLIKSIVPETVETIRRGKITYILNGKDFLWLTQPSGHVDIEFFMGASLDSAMLKDHGIKEKSEDVRHIEVRDFGKLAPEISRLVKEAARVGLEH
jgi:hypothetical protein